MTFFAFYFTFTEIYLNDVDFLIKGYGWDKRAGLGYDKSVFFDVHFFFHFNAFSNSSPTPLPLFTFKEWHRRGYCARVYEVDLLLDHARLAIDLLFLLQSLPALLLLLLHPRTGVPVQALV